MPDNSFRNLTQIIICFYFLFVPFTWSFITKVSGLLIRPYDVILILIVILFCFMGRLEVNRRLNQYLSAFSLLLLYVTVSSLINGYQSGLTSVVKMAYFLLGTVCLAQLLLNQEKISIHVFLFCAFLLIFYIIIFRSQVFDVIRSSFLGARFNPSSFAYSFWFDIFRLNLFGPSDVIEYKGVSFRNSAALGFFVLAMFLHGFVEETKIKAPLTFLILLICLFCLSRTAGFYVCIFLVSNLFWGKSGGQNWFFLFCILVTLASIAGSFAFDVINSRITSESARLNLLQEGLRKMSDNPVFGAGSEAKVSTGNELRLKTVHNIPVAFGSHFGVVTAFLAFCILWFNFKYGLFFFKYIRMVKNRSQQENSVFAAFVCCIAITLSPMVSGSVELFYSAPGWAGLSLVLAQYMRIVKKTSDVQV